jgi:hypothetical protein
MEFIIISLATWHVCKLAYLAFWFAKRIVMKDTDTGA